MAKYSNATPHVEKPKSQMRTKRQAGTTAEGDLGFDRSKKTEFLHLAVTSLMGEDTFYESATNRDSRFVGLVREITKSDAPWMRKAIPWLRKEAFMRSASTVAAVEYARAGGEDARGLIVDATGRADEPAEMLGYHLHKYGRRFPASLKRGVADAARRFYNERNALKYDGQSRGVRMADVLSLTHAKPATDEQSRLFKMLLDSRYGNKQDSYGLAMVDAAMRLDRMPNDEFRALVLSDPSVLEAAGFSWERLSGKTVMDAKAWEAVIPVMGHMALIRNLRNFDQAKISASARKSVCDRISDPAEVAKGRQFPYRYYMAYLATEQFDFKAALERALELSMKNVPVLSGKTLVLVDTSGSMGGFWGSNSRGLSQATPAMKAAVLAASFAKSQDNADLVAFASSHAVIDKKKVASAPALKVADVINKAGGYLGGGTETWAALAHHYSGHDRVVVFTDCQSHYGYGSRTAVINKIKDNGALFFNVDLMGYGKTNIAAGNGGFYEIAGWNDSMYNVMKNLDLLKDASWPWETV